MVKGMISLLVVATCLYAVSAEISDRQPKSGLIKALLPYFNLRFIYPFECATNASDSLGTCMSGKDCRSAGGKAAGTCAKGYGTCCSIEAKCGATVNRNRTILVSDGATSSCKYTIKKPANDTVFPFYGKACQVRLDFEEFTMAGPDATTSLCTAESFEVADNDASFGKICGENKGQHIILPVGTSDTIATINIAAATTAKWRIRTSYISCDSVNLAPTGCLQHFKTDTGLINSFNFKSGTTTGLQQIGGLKYSACVSGNCALELVGKTFSITGDQTAAAAAASSIATCSLDYIGVMVKDKAGVAAETYYCGTLLDTITTYASPFIVQVGTDAEEGTDVGNLGFSLAYTKKAC